MNINKSKILFTYLVAFGKTGGIEKVNRTILKCLSSFVDDNIKTEAWSLNDFNVDENYFSTNNFKGFNKSKFKFVFELIKNARTWDKVIVGHINLAFVIRLMKILNPQLKIILIVHGIEVWEVLKSNKLWLLENADIIISVSKFTKNIIVSQSNVMENDIVVLPNCLDPYFPKDFIIDKPSYLLDRYDIKDNTKVVITISRINKREGRKGYDKVIEVLHKIAEIDKSIEFKYLLCGKYETDEYDRLKLKINQLNLTNKVVFTGFINDDELIDHFRLADIYIMPSKKEGFGMVYIEAAACGLQVIAGNADGSAEALLNGEIGSLVNPDNNEEIFNKLNELLVNSKFKSKELSERVFSIYNYNIYSDKLYKIISEI